MENNGREDLLLHKNLTSYDFIEKSNDRQFDFQKQGIKSIHTENPISSLFFSEHNIDILQNGIRFSVFSKTENNMVIDKQSENELLIIMRSVYLQYCKHLPYNITSQVKELNTKVIDYSVPKILVEINQHVNFKNDISKLPIPLEHPKDMSQKGSKFLYMGKDFL
jgi:hypothetical protein